MGPVPAEVVLATFYNFSPIAVHAAMPGVWDTVAPPRCRQPASAPSRALVGWPQTLPRGHRRGPLDRRPGRRRPRPCGQAARRGQRAVALPDDPMLALWQQVTVIREWRGDVHIAVLLAHEVGPCDCMVLQVGTGRFPLGVTQATRQWSEAEWARRSGPGRPRLGPPLAGDDRCRHPRPRSHRGRHRPPVRCRCGPASARRPPPA